MREKLGQESLIQTQKPFNVLITSISRKVPLIGAVRTALEKIDANGRIHGADCNSLCIGRYFVDLFWEMPPTQSLAPEKIIDYCRDHGIRAIIPTRDGELLYFAENKERFASQGIAVLVGSADSTRSCLDKKKFCNTLKNKNNVKPMPTFDHPDRTCGKHWVVKERFGAGSRHIRLNVSVETALSSLDQFDNPICQPFVEGDEFSIDLYLSQSATPKGCVVRERNAVVDGESQVTTTVDRPDIEKTCLTAAQLIGLTGHVLFQTIEEKTGFLHMVECNCRFGGASTLSVAAGLDSFYWFFRECLGDDLSDLPFFRGPKGLRQIRYPQDRIIAVDSVLV